MPFFGCPDDTRLEGYFYRDLSAWEEAVIRLHLYTCPKCRARLSELEDFNTVLKTIPVEEPPPGFEDDLIRMVKSWDFDPDQVPVTVEEPEEQLSLSPSGWSYKVRWAMGSLVFLMGSFLQFRYGELLPRVLGRGTNLLFSLQDLGALWEYVASGAWWSNLVSVVAAIRTDGFASLEILSTALPSQALSVLVFGGITLVVFIHQRTASKDRGEGIE